MGVLRLFAEPDGELVPDGPVRQPAQESRLPRAPPRGVALSPARNRSLLRLPRTTNLRCRRPRGARRTRFRRRRRRPGCSRSRTAARPAAPASAREGREDRPRPAPRRPAAAPPAGLLLVDRRLGRADGALERRPLGRLPEADRAGIDDACGDAGRAAGRGGAADREHLAERREAGAAGAAGGDRRSRPRRRPGWPASSRPRAPSRPRSRGGRRSIRGRRPRSTDRSRGRRASARAPGRGSCGRPAASPGRRRRRAGDARPPRPRPTAASPSASADSAPVSSSQRRPCSSSAKTSRKRFLPSAMQRLIFV